MTSIPEYILQNIKGEWTRSTYSHPKTLLIDQKDHYLIVISNTTTLHRCINRYGQIVMINRTTPVKISSYQIEENSQEPTLIESRYSEELDIFAVEKLYPIFQTNLL